MDKESYNKAFLDTYENLADPLFRYFYFRVSNRELSKDLVQEAFTRTWKYLAEGKDVDNLEAFVYRVASNLVIDHYRKHRETSLDVMEEAGFTPTALGEDEKIIRNAEVEHIRDVVNKLDEIYRDVVILRYVEGMSPKEIALCIGETENVVSVRLNRAVKKLRELVRI